MEDGVRQKSCEEYFLIHDTGQDSHKCLFLPVIWARHLAIRDTWFLDGNFKVALKLFEQDYIILVKMGETAVPCVYFLMTVQPQLYEEMPQTIVSRGEQLGFSPDLVNIHLDFKQSVIQTVKGVFGNHVSATGCFYYLTQSQ